MTLPIVFLDMSFHIICSSVDWNEYTVLFECHLSEKERVCCSPLVQGVVTVCMCVCGGDRGVFTLLRCAEVFHTVLTPGTELWLKPRHTAGASVCV